MICGCFQCVRKHRLIKFLGRRQYIGIVKIPWPGVEHATAQDRFHLFCHDSFDVVCPQLVGFFIIEDFREIVRHRMGCNCVTGGYINTQRCQERIKSGVQHHPIAAVNIIFPDGGDGANLKHHAIVKRNATHFFQCSANRFRGQRQIFKRGVQVHGSAVIQANNGSHQHTALQHELLLVPGRRETDEQSLKHIVLQNHLRRNVFLFCDIADLRFQTHCIAHRSTSKY